MPWASSTCFEMLNVLPQKEHPKSHYFFWNCLCDLNLSVSVCSSLSDFVEMSEVRIYLPTIAMFDSTSLTFGFSTNGWFYRYLTRHDFRRLFHFCSTCSLWYLFREMVVFSYLLQMLINYFVWGIYDFVIISPLRRHQLTESQNFLHKMKVKYFLFECNLHILIQKIVLSIFLYL